MRRFLDWCRGWWIAEKKYLFAFVPIWLVAMGFYLWSIYNYGGNVTDGNGGHYAELAQAFKLHQLYLPVQIDPVLLHAPNPYDPDATDGHFIWDLSYYKGHYYLYFGATPCLFLFYPWLMITGQDMNQCLAYWFICGFNLIFFALILRALSVHLFPRCPVGWLALIFFVYAVGTPLSYLLRLTDMYEIAAASGGTCRLFSIYFLLVAMCSSNRRWRWLYLALSSFGWGAAAGSRPPHLYGAALLVMVWVYILYAQFRPQAVSWRRFCGETVALGLPAVLILVLIGWYNYARFESPLEFGQRFETSFQDIGRIPNFSVYYIPFRTVEYLFMPPSFHAQFPYIDPGIQRYGWLYTDQTDDEHMTGMFVSFPILLLSLLWIWHIRKDREPVRRRLLVVCGMCLTAAVAGPLLVLLVFCGGSYRYYCDFVPALYALAAFSLMARRNYAPFAHWQIGVLIVFCVIGTYAGIAYSLIGDTNWIWVYQQSLVPHLRVHPR